MRLAFRDNSPERKYTGTQTNYRLYKPFLREDFNKRCGYTDCADTWFGGKSTFHIDHFKPCSKHPDLKETYANLVYACSYVNILKSDDEGAYLDPCNENFNNHFERERDGSIVAKESSPSAIYMHKKLKLYMKRYRIIWILEKVFDEMTKIRMALMATTDDALKTELLIAQGELGNIMNEYQHYLRAEQ